MLAVRLDFNSSNKGSEQVLSRRLKNRNGKDAIRNGGAMLSMANRGPVSYLLWQTGFEF